MTDQSGPLPARLRIDQAMGMANLSLSGPYIRGEGPDQGIPLPGANDWGAMEGLAETASEYLSSVRDVCASLTLTEKERDNALETLRNMGTILLARILGKYRSISGYRLGPGNLKSGPGVTPILDVEIFCQDGLVLPAEVLPLLQPVGFESHNALRDAAALLGFGAACHRATTAPRAQADDALLDPNVVRYYWHVGLRGAREQWKWLRERFEVRGPHPQRNENSGAMANLIILKTHGQLTSPLSEAVEHFHCHHERHEQKPNSQEDVMRLKAARWKWFSLTAEIKIRADQIARVGKPAAAGLVFLNACSSQLVSLRAVSSFARELLLNGRNAVITTWSDVPDDVAFKMACFFYEAFLRGETVGTSLREARVRLLLEKNNPLGLLYTVYGDSHFRLAGVGHSNTNGGGGG